MVETRTATLVIALLAGLGSLQAAPPTKVLPGLQVAPAPTSAPPALPPLAVVDWTPRDKLERSRAPQQIRVRFNRAVVALGTREMLATDALAIEPRVAGRAVWQSPELLVFTSEKPLPESTRFRVTLRAPLLGVEGGRLDTPFAWEFETDRVLAVVGAMDTYLRPDQAIPGVVTTPVGNQQLESAIRVRADGHELPFSVHILSTDEVPVRAATAGTRRFVIRPAPRWPLDSKIEVTISRSLRGPEGPLPMGADRQRTYETPPRPRITKATCERDRVRVTFNTDLDDAERLLVASPPLEFRDRDYDGFSASAQPGISYSIRLQPSAHDEYGQSPADTAPVVVNCAPPGPQLSLYAAGGVLDPADRPLVGAESRWLRSVRIRTVVLDEMRLAAHPELLDRWEPAKLPASLPWQDRVVQLKPSGPSHAAAAPIDLSTLLAGRRLPVLVAVQPLQTEKGSPNDGAWQTPEGVRQAVFQATKLGVTVFSSPVHQVVQVVDLQTAEPVQGAQLAVARAGRVQPLGATDGHGLLQVRQLIGDASTHTPLLVNSPDRSDLAVLAERDWQPWPPAAGPTLRLRPQEDLRGALVVDRDIFRPGEKIHVVGWVAIQSPYEAKGTRSVPPGTPIRLSLQEAGTAVSGAAAQVSPDGKFWADITVPPQAKLRPHVLVASVQGVTTRVAEQAIHVKQFRTPEFAVEAKPSADWVLEGQPLSVQTRARYHFGAPTPAESARSTIRCVDLRHLPDAWEWTLGESERDDAWEATQELPLAPAQARTGQFEVKLSAKSATASRPSRCQAQIAVRDSSLREASAEFSFTVHATPLYLGLRTVQHGAGKGATIWLRAWSADGRRIERKGVQVVLRRERGGSELARWTVDVPGAGDDAQITTPALRKGRYLVRATTPEGDRLVHSEDEVHVGWPRPEPQAAPAAPDDLKMQVQRDGGQLHVNLEGPAAVQHGLLVVKSGGPPEVVPLRFQDGKTTLHLPVRDHWAVAVDLRATAYLPAQPGRFIQRLAAEESVELDLAERRLSVEVTGPATAGPGQTITFVTTARASTGAIPENARISLWAVDEAVRSLTPYAPPDLTDRLAARDLDSRPDGEWFHSLIDEVIPAFRPALPDGLFGTGAAGGGTGEGTLGLGALGASTRAERWSPRSHFETTPFFLGDAAVGADGSSTVSFRLPDNMTTYRVTAVVSAPLPGSRVPALFGTGSATVTVNLPLLVRPAVPRTLRPGDEAELAIIVEQLSGPASAVEVELAPLPGDQSVTLLGEPIALATLAAGEQRRFPFKVRAERPGTARFTMKAHQRGDGPGFADATEIAIPVAAEPALLDHVAVSGTSDDELAINVPVHLSAGVGRSQGELTVALASTITGSLEGAVRDLVTYPFACLEQTSSRLLALVVAPELAARYLPAGQTVKAAAEEAAVKLDSFRVPGHTGLAYWPGQSRSPFSSYAYWVQALASQHGLLPNGTLGFNAADDLRALMNGTGAPDDQLALALLAAVQARQSPGDSRYLDEVIGQASQRLTTAWPSLSLPARALHLVALAKLDPKAPQLATLAAQLASQTSELGATAHASGDWKSALFFSNTAVDALMLWALLQSAPHHPVVAKLVHGLQDARAGTSWRTTQDNAFALLALTEYEHQFEARAPAFTVASALDGTVHSDSRFTRRESRPRLSSWSLSPVDHQLTLRRRGRGRLYYTVDLSYAQDDSVPAVGRGLSITRQLRFTTGKASRAGDVLAMDIIVRNAAPLHYVAVTAPVPAGMDAIDLDLRTQAGALPLPGVACAWFNHQELHPDRVLLFADELPAGEHRHTIYLRALNPGHYAMPAAHAEAMYAPEVNARTASALVQIESR